MKTRIIATLALATTLIACGGEDGTTPDETLAPTEFTAVELPAAEGKADGVPIVCNDWVHKASPDITVLSARITGRASPSSNTVPSEIPVRVGNCDVLDDVESNMSDCRFYDDCRELEVDCQDELGRITDSTFLDTAVFGNVTYVRNGGDTKFYAERFNCHVVEVVTATRDAALEHAKAMGLYFEHSVTFVRPEEARAIGSAKLKNGDRVTLHRFAGLAMCWGGSMSSSAGQDADFKPFLVFPDQNDTCYVDWDANPTNYAVSFRYPEFDRWFDILQ